MSAVFEVLRMAWGFFEVECPFLGISFGAIFLGVMIMKFSISLIKPILGIGRSAVHSADNAIKGIKRENKKGISK